MLNLDHCISLMVPPYQPFPPFSSSRARSRSRYRPLAELPRPTPTVAPANNAQVILVLPRCRDKTVVVWNLTREGEQYGFARRALRGHSHFVEVSALALTHRSIFTALGRMCRTW